MVGHQEAKQFCQYFGPNENAKLKVQSQVQNTVIIDTSALIEEKSQSGLFFEIQSRNLYASKNVSTV